MLFQSENYQYMEQVASQCCGGFLRQLLQEMTGRLEQGCGTISDAYKLHPLLLQVTSYIKLQVTNIICKAHIIVTIRAESQAK